MSKKRIQNPEAETVFSSPSTGYQINRRGGIATFSVQGLSAEDDDRLQHYRALYNRYIGENVCLSVGSYHVPVWGDGHNLYPQEVDALINENKLLPGIMHKQEDFLYGHGPFLYKEQLQDGKLQRVPVSVPAIEEWLQSWERQGFDNYRDYLRQLIQDYYRVHTCITQYHYTRGRRMEQYQKGSIRALSYIGADEARLATTGDIIRKRIKQRDCRYVIVGDWTNLAGYDYDVFHRFDPAEPFRHATAVAFNSAKSFARHLYAYNDWYTGLREWIKASNLTPRYLNSYLKNALNAHVHVKIPVTWVNQKEQELQKLCEQNLHESNPALRTAEYCGVRLIDPVSNLPYRFSLNMLQDCIAAELEKITSLLSGEGKNQGKLYATTKMGQEGWEFEDFPGKFKEYFESLISYDKRADQVTLAGIGINSSITNVENDGVISKSGSDVYYNYIVYLNSLSYAEQFICREINRAIRLNFPEAEKQDIRLGFRIEIPVRQESTTPSDRIDKGQPV